MTRKDYVLIAAAVNAVRVNELALSTAANADGDHVGANNYARTAGGARLVAQQLAHALNATNPRFDRERFLTACGVQS